MRKLMRDSENAMIGGVCAGIARHINVDVSIVRIVALILFFSGTAGFWIYLVLLFVVPSDKGEDDDD